MPDKSGEDFETSAEVVEVGFSVDWPIEVAAKPRRVIGRNFMVKRRRIECAG